ncbi:MAG: MATE family efflux transporter [Planctomycetota bacterium]
MGAGADISAPEPTLAAIEDRPLREILSIAAPSIVTMTSYTVMQFVDGLMVSRIGPEPVYVAAQGNGGVIAWLMMSVVLGLTGVVNTFVSQNLGAGKPREGAGYAWNAVYISIAAWLIMMVPAAIFADELFGIRDAIVSAVGAADTGSPDSIAPDASAAGSAAAAEEAAALSRYQVEYARTMLFGAVFVVAGRALGHYFYGMHRPAIVMVAALAGNVVNLGANLVLIFGENGLPVPSSLDGSVAGTVLGSAAAASGAVAGFLGIPALGVGGAAIGSVLGAAIEFVLPVAVFLSPVYARTLGTRVAWRPDWKKIKDLLRIGWPAGAMFGNELFCWSYLMAVLLAAGGRAAGEDPVLHNTAGWIGLRYMHLSFMPAVGISIAITAVVGKCMGMGRPDLAASRTWLAVRLGVLYMGLCAVCFLFFGPWLVTRFIPGDMPPDEVRELTRIGTQVMVAAAIFQLFDAIAIVLSGALRGAGDTVWPGIATMLLSWGCIVGGGHLLIVVAPGLGSIGPWIGAAAFIILLGTALLMRFLAGKWRTLDLVDGGRNHA